MQLSSPFFLCPQTRQTMTPPFFFASSAKVASAAFYKSRSEAPAAGSSSERFSTGSLPLPRSAMVSPSERRSMTTLAHLPVTHGAFWQWTGLPNRGSFFFPPSLGSGCVSSHVHQVATPPTERPQDDPQPSFLFFFFYRPFKRLMAPQYSHVWSDFLSPSFRSFLS